MIRATIIARPFARAADWNKLEASDLFRAGAVTKTAGDDSLYVRGYEMLEPIWPAFQRYIHDNFPQMTVTQTGSDSGEMKAVLTAAGIAGVILYFWLTRRK